MSSLVYMKSKKGDVIYVYQNDKEEDGGYTRRCIGHLDPVTGEIIPNRPKAEVAKAHIRSYGVNMLLRDISDSIGLTESLKITFRDTWDSILSCAFYCLTEDSPLTEMEQWMRFNETPRMWPLGFDDMMSIMKMITKKDVESFFRVWMKRAGEERFVISLLSVDRKVEKVSKRDFERVFSSEIEFCYGERTGLPIAYNIQPIAFNNTTTLFSGSDRFEWVDSDNSAYAIEATLCNEIGLDSFIKVGAKHSIEVPSDENLFRIAMDGTKLDEAYDSPQVTTVTNENIGKTAHLHILYDPKRAESEISRFLNIINRCRVELINRRYVMSHSPLYRKYFIDISPGHVELNSEEIMRANRSAGFRVFISSFSDDAEDTIKWFMHNDRSREMLENTYNSADMSAMKLFLQANMESRLFIQFIAIILNNALEARMQEAGMKGRTVHSVLYSMKRMMRVNVDRRKNPLMTDIDDEQQEILDLLIARVR